GLVARFGGPFPSLEASLGDLEIGEYQFRLDGLDVAYRVDRPFDVGDVGIVEAPHHLEDGVDGPDVAEELIAQPLPLAGSPHQPGDVDDLDHRRHHPLGLDDRIDGGQALVGNRDHADVGLDGGEWVVGGLDVGGGQRVEESGLADVGQAHDAGA